MLRFILIVLIISQVRSQGFLWQRIIPRDCQKQWGDCYYAGANFGSVAGAYYRQEEVVIPASFGGSCDLNTERFCDEMCRMVPPCIGAEKRDCVKEWSECYGTGFNSYRIEIEVVPAQYGGTCELKYEFGCNEIQTPIDCEKSWGPCIGSGPGSFRDETILTEAKYGGMCELRREFGCNNPPIPCRKKWGKCRGEGPNSVRNEEIVTPAQNGGECNLRRQRGCNPYKPVDCVKKWGKCTGEGPDSVRTEVVVSPAQHGGKCQLREQMGCNPYKPVDCKKKWSECAGNGPDSIRTEYVVSPAKYGGKCRLEKEKGCRYEPVACTKKWGECKGVGKNSFRKEVEVTPAMYGGICKLKTQKECNTPPEDCTKRWGKCVGVGAGSFRDEEVVTKAKYGGECHLRREFGCNTPPEDCTKRWGKCIGVGEGSFRDEEVVTKAKYGGECHLRREFGCNTPPEDCVKRWGKCIGVGEESFRDEEVVTKARYGGECDIQREFGCNTPPEDCVKRWGNCIGVGPGSFRDEEVVTKAKYGGDCDVQREFGCRIQRDCVKAWGQCIGKGHSSYRKEIVKTPPGPGGRPCGEFKTEMGCNATNDSKSYEDDTHGKKIATLLIANFVAEVPKVKRAGARSLSFNFFGSEEDKEPKNQNCSEFKSEDGKVLAVGCDEADDIAPDVIKEVKRLPLRVGEKRPPISTRRKRSTSLSLPSTTPRDVLFYLDSSGSVGPYHFDVLKEVCKAVVDVLCARIALGKYQTRISMATFNRRQQLSFPFSTTSSVTELKSKIEKVKYDSTHSSQSCIKDALEYVLTDIYLAKNGARDPSYAEGDMFFMTDGCANCDYSKDNRELQRMAYRLKLNKINVYAIGIGIKENCRNILKVLARGGRCFHFFFLDDWDVDVEEFLKRLKNPPENRCLDRWEYPGINCLTKNSG